MSNMSAYPSVKSPCTELSSEASFDNNKGIASGFMLFVFSSFQPNSVQTEKHRKAFCDDAPAQERTTTFHDCKGAGTGDQRVILQSF